MLFNYNILGRFGITTPSCWESYRIYYPLKKYVECMDNLKPYVPYEDYGIKVQRRENGQPFSYTHDWQLWKKIDQARDDSRKKYPIRWFFTDTLPDFIQDLVLLPHAIYKQLRYLVRIYITERWHIVKLDIKPGYADCDKRIESAIRTLFMEYMRGDYGFWHMAKRDYMAEFEDVDRRIEEREKDLGFMQAYCWWDAQKPKLENYVNEVLYKKAGEDIKTDNDYHRVYGKIDEIETLIYQMDTKMMQHIIKHRNVLWD